MLHRPPIVSAARCCVLAALFGSGCSELLGYDDVRFDAGDAGLGDATEAAQGGRDGGKDGPLGHSDSGDSGACTAGAVQSLGSCDRCGKLSSTCVSGAWGAPVCSGQGACEISDKQSEACPQGGTRERKCSASCGWEPWTDCPSCTDGKKNGSETDVDCGGTCPNKCAISQGCLVPADCSSATCSSAHVCSGKLTFKLLGTGAADSVCWTQYGRQLSSLLVGKNLLIDLSCWTNDVMGDAGTCGLARLNQFGVDLNALRFVLITHYHQDHLDPGQLVALAQARTGQPPLTLYGGVSVVNTMNSHLSSIGQPSLITVVHLEPYKQVALGAYLVTPLIASHDAPDTEPYVYLVSYHGKRFLYGTDSDILTGTSLSTLYANPLDVVIRERTFESGSGYGHMDRDKVAAERADFIAHNVIKEATPYYLTHIAYCSVGSCAIPAGTLDPGDGGSFDLTVP